MDTNYYGYILPNPCSDSYSFCSVKGGGIKTAVLEFSSSAEIPAKGVIPYSFKPVDTIGVKLNPNGSFVLPTGTYFICFSITVTIGANPGNISLVLQSLYPGEDLYKVTTPMIGSGTYNTLTGATVVKICNCTKNSVSPSYLQLINNCHKQEGSSASTTEPITDPVTFYPMTPYTPEGLSTSTLTILKLS